MAKGKGNRQPLTLRGKLHKVDSFFVEEVEAMDAEKLDTRLANLAKYQQEVMDAQSNDIDIQKHQELLKNAKETYSGPLKASRLKMKFVYELLKEKGKA